MAAWADRTIALAVGANSTSAPVTTFVTVVPAFSTTRQKGKTMSEDTKTTLEVPADAPSAYWEGWANVDRPATSSDTGKRVVILTTVRSGRDGRSDAQYIVDRLASGLYFGRVL